MSNQPDQHARAVLPIPERPYSGLIKYDAEDGNLRYTYNLFGVQLFTTESTRDLPEGK